MHKRGTGKSPLLTPKIRAHPGPTVHTLVAQRNRRRNHCNTPRACAYVSLRGNWRPLCLCTRVCQPGKTAAKPKQNLNQADTVQTRVTAKTHDLLLRVTCKVSSYFQQRSTGGCLGTVPQLLESG